MFLLRAINISDLEGFIELAFQTRSGITSLPKNRELLTKKVEKAIASFSKEIHQPYDELYLFILEDTLNHVVCGVSGIYSVTGKDIPNYYYLITHEPIEKEINNIKLPIRRQIKLIEHINGPSELCSLFLQPKYRNSGVGKLLSLGRLLFISCFKERFNHEVIACLRGVIDHKLKFMFWENIGRKFFDVDYEEMQEIIQNDKSLVSKILPHDPIYTLFLPRKIQNIIGQVHTHSLPAKNMLMQNGFNYTNEIDPFDGGPKLFCPIDELVPLQKSQVARVLNIKNIEEEKNYLICNNKINFRVTLGQIFDIQEDTVSVSSQVATLLQLNIGDQIRFFNLYERKI